MKYNPHDYQKYATDFIIRNKIAAILLDMGLGKTSITLAAISALLAAGEITKVLIIAPLRVARNTWSDEIKKWDEFSHLKYSIVVGSAKERMKALQTPADIYIINRENVQWLIEKSGIEFDFDCCVLDELSSWKNHRARRTVSFMNVRPRLTRVIGLTGTPSGNGLMDLFSEFRCLDMGKRLGRFITQYRTTYFRPGRSNGQIVYEWIPLPGADEAIYKKISDITISMKATDHLKMPELVSVKYPVKMTEAEWAVYDDFQENYIVPGLPDTNEITAANAAALSGKLCQMANGAVYTDAKNVFHLHDAKLDALEDLIEAANGKPVLVAYWFQHDLTRIVERLTACGIPHQKLDSDKSISDFNAGKIPVALIHPASAGHGLNLQQGSNTLIWFGLTWSLELYQQTIARLWRQGQTERTVVVQHICTEGTIDEDILDALEHKEAGQNKLIAAVKARIGGRNG